MGACIKSKESNRILPKDILASSPTPRSRPSFNRVNNLVLEPHSSSKQAQGTLEIQVAAVEDSKSEDTEKRSVYSKKLHLFNRINPSKSNNNNSSNNNNDHNNHQNRAGRSSKVSSYSPKKVRTIGHAASQHSKNLVGSKEEALEGGEVDLKKRALGYRRRASLNIYNLSAFKFARGVRGSERLQGRPSQHAAIRTSRLSSNHLKVMEQSPSNSRTGALNFLKSKSNFGAAENEQSLSDFEDNEFLDSQLNKHLGQVGESEGVGGKDSALQSPTQSLYRGAIVGGHGGRVRDHRASFMTKNVFMEASNKKQKVKVSHLMLGADLFDINDDSGDRMPSPVYKVDVRRYGPDNNEERRVLKLFKTKEEIEDPLE